MAERLVAALQPPWTAAVPGFCNANPDGAVSWSNLISDYGPWLAAMPGGELKTCPPYNTVFRRSFVVEALERDEEALAPGYDLVAMLRAGAPYLRCANRTTRPRQRVAPPDLAASALPRRAIAGRGARAELASLRRAAYALGSPLLPFVLLGRCARPFSAARRVHRIPWLTAPALVAGVVVVAAGELTAFVAGGSPDVHEAADRFELHKVAYTTPRDA